MILQHTRNRGAVCPVGRHGRGCSAEIKTRSDCVASAGGVVRESTAAQRSMLGWALWLSIWYFKAQFGALGACLKLLHFSLDHPRLMLCLLSFAGVSIPRSPTHLLLVLPSALMKGLPGSTTRLPVAGGILQPMQTAQSSTISHPVAFPADSRLWTLCSQQLHVDMRTSRTETLPLRCLGHRHCRSHRRCPSC